MINELEISMMFILLVSLGILLIYMTDNTGL